MKIIQLVVVIKAAMSAAVLATLFLLTSLAYSHSDSWTFSENNNKVMLAQTKGGDATQAGDVKIEFYGHMAFKITSPDGIRILVDLWRNDPSGAWALWFPGEFPAIPVDIVLSTHAHYDHDAVYRPHATMVLERIAGQFELGDVRMTGLADKHMCQSKGWYKWTEAAAEFKQEFCPPEKPGTDA